MDYHLIYYIYILLIISRGAEGLGRDILQCPPPPRLSVHLSVCPSVCPSVILSFRTATAKRIHVFSRSNLNLYNSPCARACGVFLPSQKKTQPVPR